MSNHLKGLKLGQDTVYSDSYDADLLQPISRRQTRELLGIDGALPFFGEDVWNAFELSWLAPGGLPQVACGEFYIPCDSEAIIESKSFKLYLNSFNQSVFDSLEQVQLRLTEDISSRVGAEIRVLLTRPDQWGSQLEGEQFRDAAICLDDQTIEIDDYNPDPKQLQLIEGSRVENHQLVSHLLRSLCPVTGQPDWGSLYIRYSGPEIDPESLLRYVVGFRRHQEFHEQCVERIFVDLQRHCGCKVLSVHARYTRRGGLDINPYRSSEQQPSQNRRLFRQ